MHSSTHSLYRENHRQNIEKIRSQSKSREVLVEKLQMANLKKTVSRSRERLVDQHLSLSQSREHLMNNRLFSHSVEELHPYDYLNTEDDLRRSTNNMYIYPYLSNGIDESFSTKLYKSLRSVENSNGRFSEKSPSVQPKSTYSDGRFSVNSMTDEEYNDLLSRFYPDRSKTEEPVRQLAPTSYLGGRNAEQRHRHCSRDDRPIFSPSKQSSIRHSKTEPNFMQPMHYKKGPPDHVKKTKKSQQPKEKNITKVTEPKEHTEKSAKDDRSDDNSSIKRNNSDKKRGSVSHIEQRIQERKERMQERKQRQSKIEKKNSKSKLTGIQKQRRHSTESESSRSSSRKKDEKQSADYASRRNSYPARKNSTLKKKNCETPETTPSTSLESVKEVKPLKKTSTDCPSLSSGSPDSLTSPPPSALVTANCPVSPSVSQPRDERVLENRGDIDEAYVSLEETVDDGIFSRSESMDSSTTVDSDNTIHGQSSSSDTLHATFQEMLIKENDANSKCETNISGGNISKQIQISRETHDRLHPDNKVKEPDEFSEKAKSFTRSISTSSDIGSMLSEGSDLAYEEYQRKISLTKEMSPEYDPKSRNRSNSTACHQSPTPSMGYKLSRSNSVHLDSPLIGVARPWGEVCHGSVNRALSMFRQQSSESNCSSSTSSSSSSRRRSANWSNTEGLDHILEKVKSDEDLRDSSNLPLFTVSDYDTKPSQIPVPPPPPPPSCKTQPTATLSSSPSLVPPNQLETSSSMSCLPSQSIYFPSISYISKPKTRPSSIPIRTKF